MKDLINRLRGLYPVGLGNPPEFGYRQFDDIPRIQTEAADALEALVEASQRLEAAVSGLPVEDWVEIDGFGNPELIGYVMQAQGEWDECRNAARAMRQLLGNEEKPKSISGV